MIVISQKDAALIQLRAAIQSLDQAIAVARPAHDEVTRSLLRLATPPLVVPACPSWRRWRIVDHA